MSLFVVAFVNVAPVTSVQVVPSVDSCTLPARIGLVPLTVPTRWIAVQRPSPCRKSWLLPRVLPVLPAVWKAAPLTRALDGKSRRYVLVGIPSFQGRLAVSQLI